MVEFTSVPLSGVDLSEITLSHHLSFARRPVPPCCVHNCCGSAVWLWFREPMARSLRWGHARTVEKDAALLGNQVRGCALRKRALTRSTVKGSTGLPAAGLTAQNGLGEGARRRTVLGELTRGCRWLPPTTPSAGCTLSYLGWPITWPTRPRSHMSCPLSYHSEETH